MKVQESPARDLLRIIMWYPVRWVIRALPFAAGLSVLQCLGALHQAASRGKKRQLSAHLARLGIATTRRDACIRDYFVNHYVDQLFILVAPKLKGPTLDRHVEWEGRDHLDAARAAGRGAILVHGHFGPAHLPLAALARLGYPIKQVGNPSDEGLSWIGRHVAFRLRMHYEDKLPADIVSARGYMGPVFRFLRDNGVIMITGDGSGTSERIGRHARFTFFGHPVLFPLGPALLSLKSGASLLPMFVVPGEHKTFRIVIEAPLHHGGKHGADAVALTQGFVDRFARRVQSCPGYMHFLDRFCPGRFIEPAEERNAARGEVVAAGGEGC